MNSREKIAAIFNKDGAAAPGFWTGCPHGDTAQKYLAKIGRTDLEDLFDYFQDDCRWISADWGWRHPEGKPVFDTTMGRERHTLSGAGCFAECDSLAEVEAYPWPDPDYLVFDDVVTAVRAKGDKAVFTGLWSCFFHVLCDFFGMENYFMRMYTHPEIVEAVTTHVLDFYAEANERYFTALGDGADIFFFGNDFGSQIDLLISPEAFTRFILPGTRRLIEVAKRHGKKVMLHSCGSIARVIPQLLDAGVDALHPLQAKAAGMDAESLARRFRGDVVFVGGVDTQELLVTGNPWQIRDEVRRLRDLFGPGFIVSPSHEAILPNVPFENVLAMAEAAREV